MDHVRCPTAASHSDELLNLAPASGEAGNNHQTSSTAAFPGNSATPSAGTFVGTAQKALTEWNIHGPQQSGTSQSPVTSASFDAFHNLKFDNEIAWGDEGLIVGFFPPLKFTTAKFHPKAGTCRLKRNHLDCQVKKMSVGLIPLFDTH